MEQNRKIKSKKIEAAVIVLTVVLALIYFYPKIIALKEGRDNQRVIVNCKSFVSKTLDEAAEIKKSDLKKISDKLIEEMNNAGQKPLYSELKCPLCCSVEFDEKTNTIIVTGYDNAVEVLTRTVVNPPSFVTYER